MELRSRLQGIAATPAISQISFDLLLLTAISIFPLSQTSFLLDRKQGQDTNSVSFKVHFSTNEAVVVACYLMLPLPKHHRPIPSRLFNSSTQINNNNDKTAWLFTVKLSWRSRPTPVNVSLRALAVDWEASTANSNRFDAIVRHRRMEVECVGVVCVRIGHESACLHLQRRVMKERMRWPESIRVLVEASTLAVDMRVSCGMIANSPRSHRVAGLILGHQ